MARIKPIGILKNLTVGAVKLPATLVGRVGHTAVSTATHALGGLGGLGGVVGGARAARTSSPAPRLARPTTTPERTPRPRSAPAPGSASPVAVAVDAPARPHGDPTMPAQQARATSPATKAPPKKAATTKAPAAKTPAPKKAALKKAAADLDVTPADVAAVVAKSPGAKKAAVTKASPKKAAGKKAAGKKAPAKKVSAKKASATRAAGADVREVLATPVSVPAADPLVYTSDSDEGTRAATVDGPGHLEQPLIDPSVLEAVQTELQLDPPAPASDKRPTSRPAAGAVDRS